MNHIAVPGASSGPGCIGEERVVRIVSEARYFIPQLRFGRVADVHEVFHVKSREDSVAIFAVTQVEAVDAIFAVREVVSGRCFAVQEFKSPMDPSFCDVFKLLIEFRPIPVPEYIHDFYLFLRKFLWCHFFIVHAVLLIAEVASEETVATALAVDEEGPVTAVATITREHQVVALLAINNLVASLRFEATERINAVARLDYLAPIEAIFVVLGGEDQVTVFIVAGEIDVVRVFVIDHMECDPRHCFLELLKLLKERSLKIDLPSK